jgi:hypothetical protein
VGFNAGVGAVWYRLRCGLRSRWRASAGLAVVVAVLVGVVLTLAAGAVRTLTAPYRYVSSQDVRPDASVEQASGPPRTAELESLPAVHEAHGMTFLFGGLVPEDGRPDGGDRLDALVFAGSHLATGTRLVEGASRTPRRPGSSLRPDRSSSRCRRRSVNDTTCG